MANIKRDIIFISVITFAVCMFTLISGYWELCDYRAWISGAMCECRGEGGFFYRELFIRSAASAISGILFIIGRAVIGKRSISCKLYRGVCVILLAAVLLLV